MAPCANRLFEDVAGIKPLEDKPGFEEVAFDPANSSALSPVSAWHDTRFGRIEGRMRSLEAVHSHLPPFIAGRRDGAPEGHRGPQVA